MIEQLDQLKSREKQINKDLNSLVSSKLDLYKDSIVKVLLFTPFNHSMWALAVWPSSIYHEINLNPDTPGIADRMFFYDFLYDKNWNLDYSKKNILSLDNNFSIKDFDIIATWLTNPWNFFDILKFFELAWIERYSSNRDKDFPLLVWWWIWFSNPIPYSKYFDLFTMWESEKQFVYLVNQIHKLKFNWFENWKSYIKNKSSIYKWIYTVAQDTKFKVSNSLWWCVEFNSDLLLENWKHRFSSQIILDNTGVLVVNKWCNYNCHFCQLAEWKEEWISFEKVKLVVDELFENWIDKLIINSPSFTQYKYKEELLEYILLKKKTLWLNNFQLFIWSVRADELDWEYIDQLIEFNSFNHTYLKYTDDENSNFIAIAPDFWNDRISKLMNKKLKRDSILNWVKLSVEKWINNFNLYFMVWFETETKEDRKDIARLTKEIYELVKEKNWKLYLKTNLYIPSVNTIWQRMKMYNTNDYKRFVWDITESLSELMTINELKNIEIITLEEWNVILQSFMMRWDEKIIPIIDYIFDNNIDIDNLDYDTIVSIFNKFNLNYDDFLERIPLDKSLPWDDVNKTDTILEKRFNNLLI